MTEKLFSTNVCSRHDNALSFTANSLTNQMNKSQKYALKNAMEFMNSVVNAGTGNWNEFGEPNLGEMAVLGIVNLDILTDAFPEIAREVFPQVEVENKDQILFDFA